MFQQFINLLTSSHLSAFTVAVAIIRGEHCETNLWPSGL